MIRHCTRFDEVSGSKIRYKSVANGTGARLVAQRGVAAPCPPTDFGGFWELTGTSDGACSGTPPFASTLNLSQDGTTLDGSTFLGPSWPTLDFFGSVTNASFELFQDFPIQLSCDGILVDALLNMEGSGTPPGPVSVTQRWGLLPLSLTPACQPCIETWTGTMTRLF